MCFLTGLSAVTFSCPDPAGSGEDSVALAIVKKGYENVLVAERNDTLYVGFENRVWRWETRAVADLVELLAPALREKETLSLTCLHEGIPLLTLILKKDLYTDLIEHKITAKAFSDSLKSLMPAKTYTEISRHAAAVNTFYNKVDISIGPLFKAQFGNWSDPVQVQFSVVPSIRVVFLKGLSLTAQVILPLYNDLEPSGSYVRPGLLVLSQTFRLPLNFFVNVSAGYFTRDQYGISAELRKYFFNGKLALGAVGGYTGTATMTAGKWAWTPVQDFTWFADASYRFAVADLTIDAGYGRFIAGDMGWRCDVSRQFGEVSIGFFAMQSGGIVNGGFNFVVPLPPRRYGTKNYVRLRPESYVPWEYRAKGLPPEGKSYSTGNGIDELYFNYNPDYIRTNLPDKLLH